MITILIWLLVFLLVMAIVFSVVKVMPIPEPWKNIATLIVGLILLLILLDRLKVF